MAERIVPVSPAAQRAAQMAADEAESLFARLTDPQRLAVIEAMGLSQRIHEDLLRMMDLLEENDLASEVGPVMWHGIIVHAGITLREDPEHYGLAEPLLLKAMRVIRTIRGGAMTVTRTQVQDKT